MKLFKTIRVAENQRILWFRDGDFQGILRPGKYRFWRRLGRTEFVLFDVADAECALPNAQYLLAAHGPALRAQLEVTVVGEQEIALVSVNQMARRLALPGEVVAFWKDSQQGAVTTLDVAKQVAVPAEWMRSVQRSQDSRGLSGFDVMSWRRVVQSVEVDAGFEAILLIDGEVERVLQPGRYGFCKIGRDVKALSVDKRVQEVEVNGQEILTRDRVSLRMNATLQYRIVDTRKAVVETPDVVGLSYRVVQFALRRAIGSMTLDQLLTDKMQMGEAIQAEVSAELEQAGVAVARVGIKDVILPGEMKVILNQVVEAEKVAEANAIRRRDETQSVRALANTARQLDGNPMMARLKELEALQQVSSSVGTLNVFDGLDGVMGQLVSLKKG